MTARIGLIGYNTPTGLGTMNRQVAKYLAPAAWLVIKHRQFDTLPPVPGVQLVGTQEELLAACDTLLFVETPYNPALPRTARERGKRVVCVPMQEWFTPRADWVPHVDLFLCPTLHCLNELTGLLNGKARQRLAYVAWPYDTATFGGTPRKTVERLLFINGRGGWKGRKGLDTVRGLLRLWPDAPLTIITQGDPNAEGFLGEGFTHPNLRYGFDFVTANLMYTGADVLLYPHRQDGLGLEAMEAVASGMGVLAPSAPPWEHLPAVGRFPVTRSVTTTVRPVPWYETAPEDLHRAAVRLLGTDITDHTWAAQQTALQTSWSDPLVCEHYRQSVTGG